MRILFDTNVWIAAFLTHGASHELLEYCISSHRLLVSDGILNEVKEKLVKKFHFPAKRVKEIVSFIVDHTQMVEDPAVWVKICRDPDDDRILASAVAGSADCLVTGDEDLLVIKEHEGIKILKPGQFWEQEKKR